VFLEELENYDSNAIEEEQEEQEERKEDIIENSDEIIKST